jgi:hypothetical protein
MTKYPKTGPKEVGVKKRPHCPCGRMKQKKDKEGSEGGVAKRSTRKLKKGSVSPSQLKMSLSEASCLVARVQYPL